ncbi:DUF3291 domain-containing protein [Actinomadura scrupuli]|uniref:DUF3291 domain-containing protein n=1 Tax=Actinomadura scrupuli TaxID=559629 RepID=UPI003D99F798
MSDSHLAQFNIARVRLPLDHPEMAGFMALLDPVNALADGTPGFVWRFTDGEADDATSIRPFEDDAVIVNFSVWTSRQALWDFVYRSAHLDALRRRREWFTRVDESYSVLWWIPAGHRPTVPEAVERLDLLRLHGPGPRAFTFRDHYEPVERGGTTERAGHPVAAEPASS